LDVTTRRGFNAPIPGGVMVGEKVRIEIEAEAVLRKPE
jgi:hypothetical protein